MGKATIISGGTAGLYTVELDLGHQKKLAEMTALEKTITELEAQLLQINSRIIDSTAAIDSAQNAVNLAIIAYNDAFTANPNQDFKPYLDSIATKQLALQQLIEERRPLTADKGRLTAELGNARGRRGYLYSLNLKPQEQVWCADLTENGTGQVATIEIPGEPQITLLAPGAAAHTNADGQVLSRDVMRYDQAYLNAALLPGWQKWKPTYRVGLITNIVNDTCSVLLTPAKSSAINLDIDFKRLLLNVPIEYLDCNGKAFTDGDQVVVKFEGQSWSSPKVIGFVNNPKACGGFTFNGSVYREPNYFVLNTDPTKYNSVSIYVGFILRMPASISKATYDSGDFLFTINGFSLSKSYRGGSQYSYENVYDNYAWFGVDQETANERPGGYNRFFADVGVFEADPEHWWIPECKSVMLYFTLQQDIFPGSEPGDISTVQGAFFANNTYQILFRLNGKALINGTLITTPQTNFEAINNGYVCTYDGTYSPTTPWNWNGAGIDIPEEVTWII